MINTNVNKLVLCALLGSLLMLGSCEQPFELIPKTQGADFSPESRGITNQPQLNPAPFSKIFRFYMGSNYSDYLIINYGTINEGSQTRYHVSVEFVNQIDQGISIDPKGNYPSQQIKLLKNIKIEFAEKSYYANPVVRTTLNSGYLRYQTALMDANYNFDIGKIKVTVEYYQNQEFDNPKTYSIIDSPPPPPSPPPTPWSKKIDADINGDGSDDIVNLTKTGISTYFSDLNVSFTRKGYYPLNSGINPDEGSWLVAKLNDDNRDDLIHITGGNYVNIFMANIDGTFSVSSFNPSPGYFTSLGRWVVAKLNDDNRDDLVHIVGGNYVHTWMSNGDGSFRIGVFSPNPLYSTAIGRWVVAKLNDDNRDDLVHIVGGNYVHTWMSNGDGSFGIGTFSPSSGYYTSLGRWEVAKLNDDNRDDLVHIVGGNYVHTWMSNGDGSFGIGAFSPNPAYNTSLGRWVVAKLNNDSRDDLVHIVGGNNVFTWTSNVDGSFTVGSFSPSPDYVTSVGEWGVLNSSGTQIQNLVHFVNSDYLLLWSRNSAFSISTFFYW